MIAPWVINRVSPRSRSTSGRWSRSASGLWPWPLWLGSMSRSVTRVALWGTSSRSGMCIRSRAGPWERSTSEPSERRLP